MIDICLLGHPNVLRDGEPLKISRRKSRAILFYSAAQAQPVPRQALLELFWPDLPRTAAQQTLRTSLHGLRTELGAALQVDEQVIGIASDVRVDVQEFSEKLDAAGSDIPNLVQALSLYRGDFLEGFILPDAGAFEDWMYFERDHLRQKAVMALPGLRCCMRTGANSNSRLPVSTGPYPSTRCKRICSEKESASISSRATGRARSSAMMS